eukprot:TRINITY_DN1589_c0_g2_i2.p1 TRINITY_DN1589_c0_g2~~TRINITY_DN1589_c0_g2_i2.p1  ORF type:complete len:497 (-),score=23.81 TRINITY_DN1589_c0_g2_i2:121-1611(-)
MGHVGKELLIVSIAWSSLRAHDVEHGCHKVTPVARSQILPGPKGLHLGWEEELRRWPTLVKECATPSADWSAGQLWAAIDRNTLSLIFCIRTRIVRKHEAIHDNAMQSHASSFPATCPPGYVVRHRNPRGQVPVRVSREIHEHRLFCAFRCNNSAGPTPCRAFSLTYTEHGYMCTTLFNRVPLFEMPDMLVCSRQPTAFVPHELYGSSFTCSNEGTGWGDLGIVRSATTLEACQRLCSMTVGCNLVEFKQAQSVCHLYQQCEGRRLCAPDCGSLWIRQPLVGGADSPTWKYCSDGAATPTNATNLTDAEAAIAIGAYFEDNAIGLPDAVHRMASWSDLDLDWVIIGFAKAGTSFLHQTLTRHPSFCTDSIESSGLGSLQFYTLPTAEWVSEWNRAMRARCAPDQLKGFKNPLLIQNEYQVALLGLLGIKVIITVREPVDVFQSAYSWIFGGSRQSGAALRTCALEPPCLGMQTQGSRRFEKYFAPFTIRTDLQRSR